MSIGQAMLWALIGALVAEAFQLSVMLRPEPGKARWKRPLFGLADLPLIVLAVALRVVIGCGLAAAGAAANQICDVGPAFVTGLAAPLLVAKLFQIVTLGSERAPADPIDMTARAGYSTRRLLRSGKKTSKEASDVGR